MRGQQFNQGYTLLAVQWTRPPLLPWPRAFRGCFPALKLPTFLHCAPLLHHFLSLGLCQKVPLHMAARFPVGRWKSTALTYKAQRQCSTPLNKHALAPTQSAVVASRRHTVNLSSRQNNSSSVCTPKCVGWKCHLGEVFCWTQEDGLKSRLDSTLSEHPSPPLQPQS